jgi:hypothetical protein
MDPRPTTSAGKIKVNLAFDPQVHLLLLQMCGGPREQARFLSELVLTEAKRRQDGDGNARLVTLEAQVAVLLRAHDI